MHLLALSMNVLGFLWLLCLQLSSAPTSSCCQFSLPCLKSQGYRQKDSYIASQGPLQHTIEDFWRMIWEWKSCSIVMLTELEERGQVSICCSSSKGNQSTSLNHPVLFIVLCTFKAARKMCVFTLSPLAILSQEKCAQYWPSDGSVSYGDINVELKKEEECESYTVRDLLVTNTRVRVCQCPLGNSGCLLVALFLCLPSHSPCAPHSYVLLCHIPSK